MAHTYQAEGLKGASAEAGMGIDQLFRAQGASAFLALVAIGMRIAAFRACPFDIPICKEGLRLYVIILAGGLCNELSFIVELPEEC